MLSQEQLAEKQQALEDSVRKALPEKYRTDYQSGYYVASSIALELVRAKDAEIKLMKTTHSALCDAVKKAQDERQEMYEESDTYYEWWEKSKATADQAKAALAIAVDALGTITREFSQHKVYGIAKHALDRINSKED